MLVNTTKGVLDDSLLERQDSVTDDADKTVQIIEYYLDNEMVHRSVHVTTKKSLTQLMKEGELNG